MPRFKPVHKGIKLLPVDFDRQIQPGSFEYALCHLIDHELDLTPFHARFKNDYEGVAKKGTWQKRGRIYFLTRKSHDGVIISR